MLVSKQNIPVIVGPTASGKTALSIALAQLLNGEIVSADSRQVYKYMDIGTAKPSKDERSKVPHHLIDIKLPDEYYSAGEYSREASAKIEEILSSGHRPVVVGGSGLYIRALTEGLFGPRVSDPEVKRGLRERAATQGLKVLHAYLQKVDPLAASCLHVNDVQRIIRALEVYEITGVPISRYHAEQRREQRFLWYFVGLRWPRQKLYERIEARVDCMMEMGLVEEARRLKAMGFSPELNSLRTVGYEELFTFIAGQFDLQTTIAEIKKNSRNYAKRQITWFGRDQHINWYDLNETKDFSKLAQQIREELK